MSDEGIEKWRVTDESGELRIVEVTHVTNQSFPYWEAYCHADRRGGMLSQNSARHAVLELAANHKWNVAEVLAPGQASRSETEADLRDSIRDLDVRLRAMKESGEVTHKLWVYECVERKRDLEHHWRLADQRDNLRANIAITREAINAIYAAIAPERAATIREDAGDGTLAAIVASEVRDYVQRVAEPAAAIAAAQVASDRLAAEVQRLNGAIAASNATERDRIAALLRDHADDRVNDSPEYAEAIYDAEALVRGERPVYAPRATTKDLLLRARAGINSAYAAIAPDRAASLPPDADLGNLAELVSLEVREYVRRMEKPAAMIDAANEAATRIIRECAALRASLAAAWADGARAMRDAAVAAVRRRAEELDASVTDEEAADDEEGYGRFQEALELVDTLGELPIPEAPNTEAK